MRVYDAFLQIKDEHAGDTGWLCACLFVMNFICNRKEGSDKLYDESVAHGNMLICAAQGTKILKTSTES